MMYLLLFVLVAGVMICFAKRLTVSGEELGDALGMEASWVGALLLASITSLPELIIGGGSSLMGNQSMAVSNIFGSNIFNLFITTFIHKSKELALIASIVSLLRLIVPLLYFNILILIKCSIFFLKNSSFLIES